MNELKRELSKLTGIDFFNPKFREVLKKHFPNDKDAEEEKVDEVLGDGEEKEESEVDNIENTDKTEETTGVDNIDTESTENETEDSEEKSEETEINEVDNVEDVVDNLEEEKSVSVDPALLDAKIELELMKCGVSFERLASAKKLAKYEITSLEELDKVKDLIKEYPEWVRSHKPESFGMPVDEKTNDLTEEEKRLKAMGIDPRS